MTAMLLPVSATGSAVNMDGVARSTGANVGYRHQTRSEMLSFLPTGRETLRVLEIGCGDGTFCTSITSAGETWGIEPYAPSAAIAAQRLFKVIATTFNSAKADLPLHYFDLVICNDVIEHMTDHDAFLVSIQDHMAPSACLIGSIPNVRYYKNLFNLLVLKDWDYKDSGILDRTHYRFFTQKSLRRALEQSGFVVERLDGMNGGIDFAWNRWAVVYNIFACVLIALSGGRADDIRHVQFGFRVKAIAAGQ